MATREECAAAQQALTEYLWARFPEVGDNDIAENPAGDCHLKVHLSRPISQLSRERSGGDPPTEWEGIPVEYHVTQ